MQRNGILLGLLGLAIAMGVWFSPQQSQAIEPAVGTPRPTATIVSPIPTPHSQRVWRSVWLPLVTR